MDNLFPKNLYHSYIVEGDPEITSGDLLELLIKRNDIKINSQDLYMKVYDSFTMSDSQNIKEWHSEMAIDEGKKICIIGANFINHDAERTLLKIIEEPGINTHFFLVVPNSLVLLDTIRSRTHIVSTIVDEEINKNASNFLSLNKNQRIDFMAKMIKGYKDTESNSTLRYVAIKFINEIEKIIFEKFKKNKNDKEIHFLLKELQEKREYLNLPGSSVKMILEHLSLML